MTQQRVELWLRSQSSWTVGREGTFVDDLDALQARGVVEDYEVSMSPDSIPVDADADLTDREAIVRDRLREWASWADERGYDLPAFRTRLVPGPDGRPTEVQVLPLAVLASYEDGELAWLAPYADGDEHVSVQDRLDELAARAPEPDDEPPRPAVEAE